MHQISEILDDPPEEAFAAPLEAEEFTSLVTPLGLAKTPLFAVAISGGPDSMALAHAAHRYAIQNHSRVIAFIVDHQLRPESSTEAESTQQRLHKMGLPAEVLRWEHPPVTTRLHVVARKARYALLLAACQRHGISNLLLAHHRDDQAETILMRFAKGSGIDGLAGMSSITTLNHVRLLRPFLTVSKERLIATCQAAHLTYISDPSNNALKYARGRLRRILPLLEPEGFTADRLIDLAERAREAKEALTHYTNALLRVAARTDEAGIIRVNLEQLRSAPQAVGLRVLITCMQSIHHDDYPPERGTVLSLLKALCSDVEMPVRTLHGCIINKTQTLMSFQREHPAITDVQHIMPGESIIWDRRWLVTLDVSSSENGLVVRALGIQPTAVLDKLAPGLRHLVPQGRARAALPALWRNETLVLIPALPSQSNTLASCHILNKVGG